MKKSIVKFVQAQLLKQGHAIGSVDGDAGPKTLSALDKIVGLPKDWPKKRKLVGFIQLLANGQKLETGAIDGYWGPQTDFAYGELQRLLAGEPEPRIWRPEDLPNLNPNDWPKQSPQEDLIKYYGEVGANQAKIALPYPHKLAWNKRQVVNSFSCHEKVHDSLLRVLKRVFDHYGLEEIKRLRLDLWGGCLNVRKMRGGTKYSTHSWGIALDYDPEKNQLKWGREKANFAKPEYDVWWKLWEEEGWVSLGRSRNFDWMHVQAAKV